MERKNRLFLHYQINLINSTISNNTLVLLEDFKNTHIQFKLNSKIFFLLCFKVMSYSFSTSRACAAIFMICGHVCSVNF